MSTYRIAKAPKATHTVPKPVTETLLPHEKESNYQVWARTHPQTHHELMFLGRGLIAILVVYAVVMAGYLLYTALSGTPIG